MFLLYRSEERRDIYVQIDELYLNKKERVVKAEAFSDDTRAITPSDMEQIFEGTLKSCIMLMVVVNTSIIN
jgi:hypothetical protein